MNNLLKDNLIIAYNKRATNRDAAVKEEWKTKEREVFLNYLKEDNVQTLLEIGAGPGRDSLFFHEQGLNTYSIDFSPEMVKLCQAKGLKAEVMSFEQLEFKDDHFDSIWALNCLLHVPKSDLRDVLQEIKRVLEPSGLFYMGVYGGRNSEGVWEGDFYEPKRFFSFFEDDALKAILSEFFDIEYFKVLPADVIGGELTFQSIILRKSYLI